MAEKKTTAEKAAEKAAAKQTAEPAKIQTVNANPNIKGLTQGEKVSYLASIQNERAFIMNSSEDPSKAMVAGLSLLAQATILDIGIGEIATGSSAVGCITVINEKNYELFYNMAHELGVKLPEYKALPAPTDDQLKAAGIVGALPNAKMIVIDKKNVSSEAIEKKKEEIRNTEKAVENPADVKNEEQLKASLTAMLIKPVGEKDVMNKPDPRIQRTINFYNGYLTIKANAAKNKEKALKEVKEKSRIQLLNEISEIVGPCPFALSGISKFLRNRTQETGSIISPYTFYRRCAVKTDDTIDDQYLADIVRVLLIWSCNSQISENEALIKTQEKSVKNEKGNAKIATETAIRVRKSQIEELKGIIEIATNPSFDVVDSLIDSYKSEDKNSKEYQLAHRIVDDIMKTYYPESDRSKLNEDVMLANVQQRAGIIVNMFRDPLAQSITYKESNLTDMVEVEAPKKEETEEKPKN